MRIKIVLSGLATFSALLYGTVSAGAQPRLFDTPGSPATVKATSIDPADYFALEPDAAALARKLIATFERNGVSLVYVNAYNVQYGAYYRTRHRFNEENEYGKQDFLGKLIAAAHARGILVVAALYDHQHRGAWEASPAWRAKTARGADYNPPLTDIQFYLSVAHPEFKAWWRGFLSDLLESYPDLDGIELREPIVNWWGATADFNPAVTRSFRGFSPGSSLGSEDWRIFRQHILTRFLKDEIALIHRYGRFVHVTTVPDVESDGRLIPPRAQGRETGFDLYGLLSGNNSPDALKVELIWQQWARVHDYVAFTPEWTRRAAQEFVEQVDGLAPVIIHVELTDFGRHELTAHEFHRTLMAANLPSAAGLDFYSAFLAEGKGAWPAVKAVYRGKEPEPAGVPKDKRALILYDEAKGVSGSTPGLNRIFAVYLANLMGHFKINWQMRRIEDYARGDLAGYEYVFYSATVYRNAPQAFLSDVSVFDGTVVWMGENLFQLKESGVRLPFHQPSQMAGQGFERLRYRGSLLPARGEVILTRPGPEAQVLASATGPAGEAPFILRAGKFWYVAGSPFSFLDETNGRYLAFADLLHDILGERHRENRTAFLRVEDVSPQSSPGRLRAIADTFAQRKVPFMVGVIPFHIDPARGLRVSLSDRPQLVAALRYMVQKGGSIILHGSTHQRRGKTGVDHEFWDPEALDGVAEDGEPFVRAKVGRALREAWANDLHPIAWETPHYSATPFDYALFADYFSTFVERRIYGVWDGHDYQQAIPFMIDSDIYGGRILPENLGYIKGQEGDLRAIAAGARALTAVRDGVAGAFVHPKIPPEQIGSVIDELFKLDYTFVDLNDLPNLVRGPSRIEITGYGHAMVAVPSGFYLEERLIGRDGAAVRSRLEKVESYSRFVRSFDEVPGNGTFSLRVVSEGELSLLGRGRQLLGEAHRLFEIPSRADPVVYSSYFVGLGAAALAALGFLLLLVAYLSHKLRPRRGASA